MSQPEAALLLYDYVVGEWINQMRRNIDYSLREIAQRLHCQRCRWPEVSDRQSAAVGWFGADPVLSLATDLNPVA